MEAPVRRGDRLVVYGSLRAAFDTQRRLGIDRMLHVLGPAAVAGRLHDLGAYPALTEGNVAVVGELYEVVDPAVGDVLDPFEGYDPADPESSQYVRERVTLISPPGVEAWVYRHREPLDDASLVRSGDWVTHLAASNRDGTLGPTDGP
jgi:gamma-glutamylcyclotransferase (GGCT)/AIG2-like uncharacterized protein YtfP